MNPIPFAASVVLALVLPAGSVAARAGESAARATSMLPPMGVDEHALVLRKV